MRSGLRSNVLGALCLTVLLAAGPPDSPVADAAMRGDGDAIRALLQNGADVNAAQGDGMTALHWAAQLNDLEMADMLLYAGADVEAATRIGAYRPLHVAAREGNADMVEKMLGAGANPEAVTTGTRANALHMAAGGGNTRIIAALLDRGVDIESREGEYGQTPLIFAAAWNRAEAIELLLERGADPNSRSEVIDLVKQADIDRAADRRRDEVIEAATGGEPLTATASQIQEAVLAGREIQRTGVIPEVEEDENEGRGGRGGGGQRGPPDITTRGELGPLHQAARQGHVEAVSALVAGGADVNLLGGGDGSTPMLIAAINGQFDVLIDLLEAGADPNIASTLNGVVPLWAVVNSEWQPRTRYPQPQERYYQEAGYLDAMAALIDAGADLDHQIDMHPYYMTFTGCGNGNCGLINTQGATAFLRAAYAADVAAMRVLWENGADPMIATRAPAPREPRLSGDEARYQEQVDKLKADEFAELNSSDQFEILQRVRDGLPQDNLIGDFSEERLVRDPIGAQGELVIEVERFEDEKENEMDPSGLPKVQEGDPAVYAIHAASGVGYGEGFAGNAHRVVPNGWIPAVKFLIEEVGMDVNLRDVGGYNAVHHAASRGDNEMIMYLVEQGADIMAVSRRGQTTVDMANSPVSRVSPIPETVALLESLGAINNHNCIACE